MATPTKAPLDIASGGKYLGQDTGILEQMQKLIAERDAEKNSLSSTISRASAWGSGGVNGPSAQLNELDKRAEEEDLTTFGMKQQVAAFQRQRELAKRAQSEVMSNLGSGAPGAGGGFGTQSGGVGNVLSLLDPSLKQQYMQLSATDPLAAKEFLRKQSEELNKVAVKERLGASNNTKQKYWIPGHGYEEMTPNEYLALPAELKEKIAQETYKRLGYVPGVTSGAFAAGVAPTGQAATIAKQTGAPIISGDRTNVKQQELYDNWIANGRKGNPVARPGTSKHETGNAIDVDMKRATPEQIAALKQQGFIQPMPDKDPNHWELASAGNAMPLTGAKADVATPAAPAGVFNEIKPMPEMPKAAPLTPPTIKDTFPVLAGEENQAVATPTGAPSAAPAAPTAPVSVVPTPVTQGAAQSFPDPEPKQGDFNNSTEYENAYKNWEANRDAFIANQKEQFKNVSSESAKANADVMKEFVKNTDRTKINNRSQSINRLEGWLNKYGGNERVMGLMSRPDLGNAILSAMQQGIGTPIGPIGVPGIQRIVQSTLKGLTTDEVQAVDNLMAIMGPRILDIVEQTKGASSDKDWNAYVAIAGNSNSGYDFLKKAAEYDKVSLKRDESYRDLWNKDYVSGGKGSNYGLFQADSRLKPLDDEYREATNRIANTTFKPNKVPPRPKGMPSNAKAQYSPSTNSFWVGNTEYKVE